MRSCKRRFWIVLVALLFSGTLPEVQEAVAGRNRLQNLARPEALSAAEEQTAAVEALARRFNPAMALPTRDIWPTPVSFAWADGPPLMARVVAKTGKVVSEYLAFANDALQTEAWADLPHSNENGDQILYYVDAPGDDRVTDKLSGWLHRWRELMQNDGKVEHDVSKTAYPPTQYAHVFWFNREKGLLGIQYWFYYPYNSWINRHEGDWEHVNVVLQGPTTLEAGADFKPVGVQYFFHGLMYEPTKIIDASPSADEFHPMVFAGGRGKLLFWNGDFSGGSYPFPAYFEGAGGHLGPLSPGDDTRHPKRFIRADQFDVVVLPEPDRLDAKRNPELSWLKLPFYAGQWKVHGNVFLLDWMGRGGPPSQPGRRSSWNGGRTLPFWEGTMKVQRDPLTLPPGWTGQIRELALSIAAARPASKPQTKRPDALAAPRYLPTNWR